MRRRRRAAGRRSRRRKRGGAVPERRTDDPRRRARGRRDSGPGRRAWPPSRAARGAAARWLDTWRPPPRLRSSGLELLQERDALLGQLHALLDEVVLDAARLRRLERLRPVDTALADRLLPASAAATARRARLSARRRSGRRCRRSRRRLLEVDVLQVHRDEAPGVFREVLV